MDRSPLYIIDLEGYPIYSQLLLEEALLRSDDRNFCLINQRSTPAVVMGISAKPDQLLHLSKIDEARIPVIRRFSGGGTVVIDEDTIFVSLIFKESSLKIPLYPEPILRFTENLFKEALGIPFFELKENDFVIGEKKCGGNAQYIQKERWLQHTSFLWDYQQHQMELLKMPSKRPNYRKDRSHDEFLCRLKDHIEDRQEVKTRLLNHLDKKYILNSVSKEEVLTILERPFRKATLLERP